MLGISLVGLVDNGKYLYGIELAKLLNLYEGVI